MKNTPVWNEILWILRNSIKVINVLHVIVPKYLYFSSPMDWISFKSTKSTGSDSAVSDVLELEE